MLPRHIKININFCISKVNVKILEGQTQNVKLSYPSRQSLTFFCLGHFSLFQNYSIFGNSRENVKNVKFIINVNLHKRENRFILGGLEKFPTHFLYKHNTTKYSKKELKKYAFDLSRYLKLPHNFSTLSQFLNVFSLLM